MFICVVLGVMVILSFYGFFFFIGMKIIVSEVEYFFLCEGIRREKGDLVLVLMIIYKDD